MTPQELKNSILQRAIEGKLVEQRPEEGTGEELYKLIQKEKEQLIEDGKIKKQNLQPEIKEDEIPFDIPITWKWVRLGDITEMNPKNQLSDDLKVGFVPMALVEDGYNNKHTYEIKEWKSIKKGYTHFADGDIGIAKITPCFQNRKSVILSNLPNGYGAGTTELSIVRPYSKYLCPEYLLNLFKSHYFINGGIKSFSGTAGQQRIDKNYLMLLLLPLPPLKEQKRIVEKIEELMPLIGEYEEDWQKIEEFNKKFPEDMKKSLLQEAIKGKLVEQRPEEGTGEELYKLIQKEKKQLIEEGKIKKQKSLPEIMEDEIPFDIPETWKWVRLGNVINFKMGKTPPRSELQWWAPEIPWVSISDMIEDGIITETKEGISREALEQKFSNNISTKGTLLMSFKLTVGRVSILNIDAVHNEAIISIYPIIDNDDAFKFYLFKILPFITQFGETKNAIKGKTLNSTSLNNLLLPLPPLQEQKRIVERLEEFLPLCDKLIVNNE